MLGQDKQLLRGVDEMVGLSGLEPVEAGLKRRRDNLLKQVADIDKAIELLEKQPELLETLNVMRRVGV